MEIIHKIWIYIAKRVDSLGLALVLENQHAPWYRIAWQRKMADSAHFQQIDKLQTDQLQGI